MMRTCGVMNIYPHTPGVNRGVERIVMDSKRRVYYTNDHYSSFWKMNFIK